MANEMQGLPSALLTCGSRYHRFTVALGKRSKMNNLKAPTLDHFQVFVHSLLIQQQGHFFGGRGGCFQKVPST